MVSSYWHVGNVLRASSSLPIIPTFVLPYKRYAAEPLLPIAKEYLASPALSLRTSVQHQGQAFVYADDKQARALSHTTLWRWLTWLGAMTVSLAVGNELFMQAHPSSSVHRFEGLVDPRKTRSPSRQQSLSIARRLLYLQSRWDEAFAPQTFFPRFATDCRPP